MNAHADIIRSLNDQLRRNFSFGAAFMTPGVAALGIDAVERIVKTVAVFDDFCHDNDPYSEHDFGNFEVDGETIFFKIAYYSKDMQMGSTDPSDPLVTTRAITIMLASEY